MLYREWNLDEAKEVWAEETREEIAENMLDMGMSVEQIKTATKLPISTIKKLQKQKQKQKQ